MHHREFGLKRLLAQPFIWLILGYQRLISPFLPKVCRFQPSCSEYALSAFGKFSVPKALYLSIWRILRCNPFCQGGSDPLP